LKETLLSASDYPLEEIKIDLCKEFGLSQHANLPHCDKWDDEKWKKSSKILKKHLLSKDKTEKT
jgi:hypothetical protein